ncbi:MAG: fibrillarin-like rRNA/tRNA 2'-O-methyltransferase [Thermoplasmata archaeon]
MRPGRAFRPVAPGSRLVSLRLADRTELWTETVGVEPTVYGERWAYSAGRAYRSFEPARSKLSAAIVRDWSGPLPEVDDRWLYLGAASGTTTSHVADLVGLSGRVYALERSLRPFGRLLALARRWPNLYPVLADAREPRSYSGLVPLVRGLYADIAQADQVEIVRANAALFLEGPGAGLLLALKTASMGRDASAPQHVRRAEEDLGRYFDLEPSVRLDPFHRGHYLVGGVARPELFEDGGASRPTPRRARSPERSRR